MILGESALWYPGDEGVRKREQRVHFGWQKKKVQFVPEYWEIRRFGWFCFTCYLTRLVLLWDYFSGGGFSGQFGQDHLFNDFDDIQVLFLCHSLKNLFFFFFF